MLLARIEHKVYKTIIRSVRDEFTTVEERYMEWLDDNAVQLYRHSIYIGDILERWVSEEDSHV